MFESSRIWFLRFIQHDTQHLAVSRHRLVVLPSRGSCRIRFGVKGAVDGGPTLSEVGVFPRERTSQEVIRCDLRETCEERETSGCEDGEEVSPELLPDTFVFGDDERGIHAHHEEM